MKKKVSLFIITLVLLAIPALVNANTDKPKAEKGDLAPNFSLTDTSGKTHKLSDYKGKVVFLNFWALWCTPCLAEMPDIDKLNIAMQGKDFIVLTINIDTKDRTSDVKKLIEKGKYGFTVLLDPKMKAVGLFGVGSLPATFIINKQGKILKKITGAFNYSKDVFKDWVNGLLLGNVEEFEAENSLAENLIMVKKIIGAELESQKKLKKLPQKYFLDIIFLIYDGDDNLIMKHGELAALPDIFQNPENKNSFTLDEFKTEFEKIDKNILVKYILDKLDLLSEKDACDLERFKIMKT